MPRKSKKNKVNNSFDFILFITVLLLLALGIIMVLSASSPSALATTGSSYTYVMKQVLSATIGIIAMLIISKIDYKVYERFYKIVYVVSILVLLLVLVPGLRKNSKWCKKMDKFTYSFFFSTIRNNKNRINRFLCSLSNKP